MDVRVDSKAQRHLMGCVLGSQFACCVLMVMCVFDLQFLLRQTLRNEGTQ